MSECRRLETSPGSTTGKLQAEEFLLAAAAADAAYAAAGPKGSIAAGGGGGASGGGAGNGNGGGRNWSKLVSPLVLLFILSSCCFCAKAARGCIDAELD